MEVKKLNQSISDVHAAHTDVLNKVITSNQIMKTQLELTFSDAQKEIKRLNSVQNTLILLTNETESKVSEIWHKTESYVEDTFNFFLKKFYLFCSVALFFIMAIVFFKGYSVMKKQTKSKTNITLTPNNRMNTPLNMV